MHEIKVIFLIKQHKKLKVNDNRKKIILFSDSFYKTKSIISMFYACQIYNLNQFFVKRFEVFNCLLKYTLVIVYKISQCLGILQSPHLLNK